MGKKRARIFFTQWICEYVMAFLYVVFYSMKSVPDTRRLHWTVNWRCPNRPGFVNTYFPRENSNCSACRLYYMKSVNWRLFKSKWVKMKNIFMEKFIALQKKNEFLWNRRKDSYKRIVVVTTCAWNLKAREQNTESETLLAVKYCKYEILI